MELSPLSKRVHAQLSSWQGGSLGAQGRGEGEDLRKRALFSDMAKLGTEGEQMLNAAARGAAEGAGLRADIAQIKLLLVISRRQSHD